MGEVFNQLLRLKYAGNKTPNLFLPKNSRFNSLIFIAGEFTTPPFDGNAFFNSRVELLQAKAKGVVVTFGGNVGYGVSKVEVIGISITGQYCDSDGVAL